jgi:hypothetical protein
MERRTEIHYFIDGYQPDVGWKFPLNATAWKEEVMVKNVEI